MSEEARKGNATSLKVTGWWFFWTAVAFLMLLGFMFWLLFQWGGFGGTATADGAKLAAGILAVVGTVLTASVTFVGLLLRLAQQERAIQIQADAEVRRAEAESRLQEAESRLQKEAAIQAVSFMGDTTANGSPISNGQRAGAIYALANLGQMPLALVLLQQLWEEGKIDSSFGVLMISDALQGDHVALESRASGILRHLAGTLWSSGGVYRWPDVARNWTGELSSNAQFTLARALLEILLSRPAAQWGLNATANAIGDLASMLVEPKTNERVKVSAARSLNAILDSGLLGTVSSFVWQSGESMSFAEIKSLADEALQSGAVQPRQLGDAVRALEKHLETVD